MALFYSQNMKEEAPIITKDEYDAVATLWKKFRVGKLAEDEKMLLTTEEKLLPQEVQD